MLRASMNPCMVSVIPNAVDANVFMPDISKKIPGKSELHLHFTTIKCMCEHNIRT